jgi:hypothetical protein
VFGGSSQGTLVKLTKWQDKQWAEKWATIHFPKFSKLLMNETEVKKE